MRHHPSGGARTVRARRLGVALAAGTLAFACQPPRPSAVDPATQFQPAIHRPAPTPRAGAVQAMARAHFDSLDASLARLEGAARALSSHPGDTAPVRVAFEESRRLYKRMEFIIETFAPTAAWEMNGPALPEVDDQEADRPLREPQGFQVLEELIFPAVDPDACILLAEETRNTRALLGRVRSIAEQATFSDDNILDGMRREFARIVSLGLSGFDSPVARRSLAESAEALRGVRLALDAYAVDARAADAPAFDALLSVIDHGIAELEGSTDFEHFDRLGFIVTVARPAGLALATVRTALGVPVPDEARAWRADVPTPYEPGAFDALAFAPTWADSATPVRVALGQALFRDTELSGDGTRSCATCHVPERAFQDGRARAQAVTGSRAPLRNTPTLLNAALQPALHADGRLAFLEDQASDVTHNVHEMAGNLAALVARWNARADRRAQFAQAFGVADSSPVTAERITSALATYVRSLEALDSPFDRALRGDTLAISDSARRGFTVFMGKGLCGTCHFAPLFNGVVPNRYEKTEYEVIGVPATAAWRGARVDADSGRGPLHRNPLHQYAFRTPTVRNVALTGPYMHNGVYRTLEEVVRFYNMGGGAGIGVSLDHQTLPADSLGLTAREQADLVAFLRALTDVPRDAPR